MGSKYLRHIDITEVLSHVIDNSLAKFERAESIEMDSVPPQFARDVLWRCEYLTHAFADYILRPDCEIDVGFPIGRNEFTTGILTVDDFHSVFDVVMDNVWETLRWVLKCDCSLTIEAAQLRMSEHRIFEAIQDGLSCIVDPDPADYVLVVTLLIYQYDRLFLCLRNNDIEGALYIVDDIAGIRSDLSERDVKGYSENWKKIDSTEKAKERAAIRHQANNDAKRRILNEWDESSTEYSSRADFTRIISARDKLKYRTVYDWIAAHDKSKE